MGMTTTFTLAYEGPPQGGFDVTHWQHLIGQRAHVPGLDRHDDYPHIVRDIQVSPDRKTVSVTVDTVRPHHHDLAQHLSVQAWTPPAAVHAVHHQTGVTLEHGHYERPLHEGETIRIDKDRYQVARVEWPQRGENGVVGGDADEDLQVAHLVPLATETVTAVNQ